MLGLPAVLTGVVTAAIPKQWQTVVFLYLGREHFILETAVGRGTR